jgi:hypothetical protein
VVALKVGNLTPEEEHPVEGDAMAFEVAAEYDDVATATDNPMSDSLGAGLLLAL